MTTKIYTTAEIAEVRGVTPTSVARIARKHGIGTRKGRDWLFTASDRDLLFRLLRDRPGNPHHPKPTEWGNLTGREGKP